MFKTNNTRKTMKINKLKKVLAGMLAVGTLAASGGGMSCNETGRGNRLGNYAQPAGDDIECLYDPNCW